jgi:stage III sporulation protein SpoIIIAA
MLIAEDFENLLKVLPQFVQNSLKEDPNVDSLVEIVLDLGRMPEARFLNRHVFLTDHLIKLKDIDFSIKRFSKFSSDNRAGVERTLHRISSIRNRENAVIGLTCRIGRAVLGVISIIRDLIEQEESILILGKPGVGKTTAIREISRILSDEMGKRVVIIDTSNEIAGDGDTPHPAIGSARRMQVAYSELQHCVMIEAVENHMPQVIIIDEISTELEALAARTIAERGVKLIGTAHGNSLESLIKNPILSDLIGGIQYVTLGDEEARTRGTQKSILERKARPAFKICLEISDTRTWVTYPNIEKSVDQILQNYRELLENQVRIFRDNKFRQIIQCKSSDFVTLYVFENTLLRILSVQKNTFQFNIEGWVFEWS